MLLTNDAKDTKTMQTNTSQDMDSFNEFMNVIKTLCGVDLEPKRDITLQRITIFIRDRQIKSF